MVEAVKSESRNGERAAGVAPVERRPSSEWKERLARLGRLDFGNEQVRKANAARLISRTRLTAASEPEKEASVSAGGRSGFDYALKTIGGGSIEVVSRLLALSGREHLSRPYEESGWVYACITALASAVASVRPRIFTRDPELFPDSHEEVTSGPLYDLLIKSPNDHQSTDEFYRSGVTHRRLDGEDVWFLMDSNGDPIEAGAMPAKIVPWRGSLVDILTDRDGFPAVYRWPWRINSGTAAGDIIDGGSGIRDQRYKWFPAHAVVHFRDYDPSNPARGIGAVEVLSRDLEQEFQAGRYQSALLENSGDPGGWIVTKKKQSPAVQRAAQEKLDDETTNVRNRGRWKYVADPDATIVPNATTPKDLEFATMLAWVRDKVASVMGVPPVVIGIYDRATFRNFETAMRQFWTGPNGVVPYLRSVESTLDARFFAKRNGAESEYRLRFDIASIEDLQEDMTDKLNAAVAAAEGGNELTLAQAFELYGIDVPEGFGLGGQVFLPQSTTTLELVIDPPEPPAPVAPAESDDDEDEDEDDDKSADTNTRGASEIGEGANELHDDKAQRRAERRAFFVSDYKTFLRGRQLLLEKAWRKIVAKYLRERGRAQITRIRSFAEGRKSAALSDFDFRSEFTLAQVLRAIELDPAEWDAKFTDAVTPIAKRTFVDASENMAQALGGGAESFVASDTLALKFSKRQVAQLVEGVNSRLSKEVGNLVQQRLKDGATSADLRVALRQILPDLTPELRKVYARPEQRAQAIARTETGKAVNAARSETMKKNGVGKHEWSSSGDDAVRDSHTKVDGQVRKIGSQFSNGLTRPHEEGAPAAEVVNCRCSTFPADDE